MRKKIISALLTAIMLFALTACSVSTSSTSTTTITTSRSDGDSSTSTSTVTTHTSDENGSTSTTTVTTSESDVNGSTTTVTTSKTDENGETTTETVTSGTDVSGDSSDDLSTVMAQKFFGGAEGVSKDGDKIFLAYDDAETFSYAAIAIVTDDGQTLFAREGDIVSDDDWMYIVSDEYGDQIPFSLSDAENEQDFVMSFKDGDSAVMTLVDPETVISDMIALLADFGV